MKTILFSLATVALLTLQACQSDQRQEGQSNAHETEDKGNTEVNTEQETPVKMIEKLVGEWERTGDPQTNQQDNSITRIRFTSEARYISYEGNQKIDSGAYRMNEQLNNLYLESEINEEPKEYEVELSENQLKMKPTKTDESGETEFVYSRRE